MKRNLMLAFVGIDGSGKSSLIEGLKERLRQDGLKTRVVYMGLGSNQKIPFLGEIMKIYSKLRYGERVEKKGYHKSRDNYRERNLFWLLVQYTDLWIRYLGAKKYSKKSIVLFDRFFYDGLILSSDLGFKIFKHITPLPDRSFLIKAPASVIMRRKNEAGSKDIKEYYSRAKRLEKSFEIIVIDNTKEIQKVVNRIYDEIFIQDKLVSKVLDQQKKFFSLLEKRGIKYVVLRGFDGESIVNKKDLDILVSKEDFKHLGREQFGLNRAVHFYPGEERHWGMTFIGKRALSRRVFDSEKSFFVLSERDRTQMIFFRIFLRGGRIIKKFLGFYKAK